MALSPFSLSDGTKVNVGDWVCTPPHAMMRDPINYAKPLEFHGFRFVDPSLLHIDGSIKYEELDKPSQFTDLNDWLLWGAGRNACPGRFYAAALMKTVLGLLITKYDMEFETPGRTRWIAWRTFIYPLPWTKMVLRSR